MRSLTLPLVVLATGAFAMPAEAQDNLVTMGIFLTVRSENVAAFEQAGRAHHQWHASQNDPQPWVTYQAFTGRGEYAVVAPDMAWASIDSPAVDMAADAGQWAETGAQYVETEEVVLWRNLPGGNPPEDPSQYPVIQVIEFEVASGSQPVVMRVVQQATEALSQAGMHFEWSAVVSADGPPSIFLAFWYGNFAELGTPGPGPDQMMADAFGPGPGVQILNDFSAVTRQTSSQIWVFRPDLSYLPAM